MKLLLLFLSFTTLLFYVTLADDTDYTVEEKEAWKSFVANYERNYKTSEEEALRKKIFITNFRVINAHNERYDRGEVTYTMRINKFADWTPEEIKTLYGKYKLWFAPSFVPAEIIEHEK